jgi:hypothetical protein
MNYLRHITLAVALMAAAIYIPASAKNTMVPKAYMFGFIASFNDSIVFFTDIQEVDSVWFQNNKKNLLAGRSNYSYQLREFFANNFNLKNRTCVVIYDKKRKNVEKKYEKMKKQYTEKGAKYDVHFIDATEFRFSPVNMDDSDQTVEPAKQKKEKKQKPPKDGKRPPRDGKMPPPPKQ